jgi:hypothetical protein
MATDWQVGDLAVCVDADPCWCCESSGVELNALYRVTAVLSLAHTAQIGLQIENADPGYHPGFGASRFRKVEQPKNEACEPEFVQLLKRSKVQA